MDSQKFTNWRFNPFTNDKHSVELTEEHKVKLFPEAQLYGIQAVEGIKLDDDKPITLKYKDTDTAELIEVPKTKAPDQGEFRVDYDAETYYGTSLVELNSADDGKTVIITYEGTGSIVKSDYVFNQLTTIPTHLEISGNLEVTGTLSTGAICPVGVIVAYSPGYFGDNINGSFAFAGVTANTIQAVNEALPDNWRVCDGTAPNDGDSPVFNAADRFLPNLTNDRFLMGDNLAGGIGGKNNTNLTVDQLPSHNHSMNHGHTLNYHPIPSGHNSQNNPDGTHFLRWYSKPYFSQASRWFVSRTEYNNGSRQYIWSMLYGPSGLLVNDHTGNTGSEGSGADIENRPRYLSCFYIMRIK